MKCLRAVKFKKNVFLQRDVFGNEFLYDMDSGEVYEVSIDKLEALLASNKKLNVIENLIKLNLIEIR